MSHKIAFWPFLVVLMAACVTAAADDPPKPKQRHLHLDYRCEVSGLPEGAKTVDLWIPIPSTDERQTVKWLNEKELAAGRVTQDKTFGNRLYYRRFDAFDSATPISVNLSFDVDVREQTVEAAKKLIATSADVPTAEFEPYLKESRMIPIKGRITELAQTIKLPAGEPLQTGRVIYDYLVDTMVYNYLAPGAGKGDAVWACDSKTGDCSDYNSIFIGVARWRGIPADHVFGPPLPTEKTEGDAKHCHCWARFWVKDVGWVPIDPSRADKFPQDRDYYFGTLGSTWVTLTHGRDVVLEPPQQGPPLNMLHGPVAEVDGKPLEKVQWNMHYKDRQDVAAN